MKVQEMKIDLTVKVFFKAFLTNAAGKPSSPQTNESIERLVFNLNYNWLKNGYKLLKIEKISMPQIESVGL